MKKATGAFLTIALLSTMIFIASCNKADPTVGNLHITVIDSIGTPVPGVQAAISTSRQNEIDGIFTNTGWTDASGMVKFQDLVPGFYWYGVPGWKNFGAVEVYAGIDQYVYLILNSPVNHP
jgi:hypothetical protein